MFTCHHHIHRGYHSQHRCCGVNKPTDWEIILGNKKPLDLPTTCCEWAGPGKCTVENAIPVGCKVKMNQYVQKYYIIWFALGFAVINLIQVYIYSGSNEKRNCFRVLQTRRCWYKSIFLSFFFVSDYWHSVHFSFDPYIPITRSWCSYGSWKFTAY